MKLLVVYHYFKKKPNNNDLNDKHNVRSNDDSLTVDGTPLQPPPKVSACSLRLTHSICT